MGGCLLERDTYWREGTKLIYYSNYTMIKILK